MEGVAAILVVLLILLSIGGIVVFIMHLAAMSSALEAVPQPLRKMPPGNVWLTLIPFFGIVWQFIVVGAVSDSLKAEFMRRNVPRDEDRPGYSSGLTACILMVCGIIPWLGIIISLIGFIFRIIHMNRIKSYTNFLKQNPYPFMPEHMAFAYNQPVYNAQQQYQQQYNAQQQYQQPYNPQQQPYNQQQQYQQPYNPQQQYQQPPVAPPQNDPNKYMPPTPPPANDSNPWAPKSDNPPTPPPAQ